MARPFSGPDDEWEDSGSFLGDQLTSHGGAFANWYSSTADIHNLASQTGITSQQNDLFVHVHGGNAEPHQLSEQSVYSDFNTTASLDPVAVQSAVQGTSSWFDNSKSESVADSGFYSAPSNVSSIHHAWDPSSTYSASSLSYPALETSPEQLHVDIEQSFNDSSFVPPWHPGARVQLEQEGALAPFDYFLDTTHRNSADADVSSQPKSSVRSHTQHTDKASHGDVTTCEHCGAQFTGRYRRGNCARHVRQQHARKSAQQASDCVCRVCKKPFARQDARRKHEWRKHGLQDTRPHPRRQEETHEDDASHAETHETYSDQGTAVTLLHELLPEPAIPTHYRVPSHPQRAHDHFVAVNTRFGSDSYTTYCETFLADSRSFVTALRERRSPIHHIFDRALRGLSAQLLPEQLKHEASPFINDGQLVDADSETRGKSSRARQKSGKVPAGRRISNASAASHPYGGRPNKKTNGDPLVALLALFKMPDCLDLDCPVHKWYLARDDQGMSTCNGCAKEHMNGVRQHLLPTYSQQHSLHVSFLKRCKQCKEDVVSDATWRSGGHEARTCPSVPQPRDIEVLVWARLYLKIFPQESRVPSPYVNDMRYLPDELVAQIRRGAQLTAPMSSNLARPQPTQLPALPIRTMRGHGPEERDNAVASQMQDLASGASTSTDDIVALDVMIARAEHLLVSLREERRLRASRGPVNVDEIEADFYARRSSQQDASQTALQYTADHMSMPPPQIQIQAPITGGADFQLPSNQPELMTGTAQVPDSYMGTQPSTYGNFQDDASYRRQSLLDSSMTDYDFGPPSTYVDQPQSAGAQFYAPMEQSACPPATYFPNDPWMYDPRLDVPGSSRLPQIIAEEYYNSEQLAADVDQIHKTETSMPHSSNNQRMSTSHTPTDYEEEDFEPQQYWYGQ